MKWKDWAGTLAMLMTGAFCLAGCGEPSVDRVAAQPLMLATPAAVAANDSAALNIPQQIVVVLVTPTPQENSQNGQDGQNQSNQGQSNQGQGDQGLGQQGQGQQGEAVAQAQTTPQAQNNDQSGGNQGSGESQGSNQSQGNQPDSQQLISQGEQIYTANCASCHQANGQGSSAFPALTGSEQLTAQDPTAAIQTVLNGPGQMPAFADQLADDQIAAVLSYERNSWGNNAGVITAQQVSQVRQGGSAQSSGDQEQQSQSQQSQGDQSQGQQQSQDQQQGEQAQDQPGQDQASQAQPSQDQSQQSQGQTAQSDQNQSSQGGQQGQQGASGDQGQGQPANGNGQVTVTQEQSGNEIVLRIEIVLVTPEASGSAGGNAGNNTQQPSQQATPSPSAQATPSPGAQGNAGASEGAESTPMPSASPGAQSTPSEGTQESGGEQAGAATTPQVGNTGESTTGQTDTGQSNNGQSNNGQSNNGQSNTDQGNMGQGNTGQGNNDQSSTGQSNNGQSNSGEANTGSGADQEILAQGEQVYNTTCAGCHQLNGMGNTAYPALNNSAVVTADDPTAAILTIVNGRGQMPAFGDTLSDAEIAAVLSHERNSWDNSASIVTEDQVRQTRQSGGQGNQQGQGQSQGNEQSSGQTGGEQAQGQSQDQPAEEGAGAAMSTPVVTPLATVEAGNTQGSSPIVIQLQIVVATPSAGGDANSAQPAATPSPSPAAGTADQGATEQGGTEQSGTPTAVPTPGEETSLRGDAPVVHVVDVAPPQLYPCGVCQDVMAVFDTPRVKAVIAYVQDLWQQQLAYSQ